MYSVPVAIKQIIWEENKTLYILTSLERHFEFQGLKDLVAVYTLRFLIYFVQLEPLLHLCQFTSGILP